MDDGRCLISSTGERRFRVVGRGMIDGYHMAQIVFLFDERVTDQEEISKYSVVCVFVCVCVCVCACVRVWLVGGAHPDLHRKS